MPLPTPPAPDTWWCYHNKPKQIVYVYTTATRWDDKTEQIVVFAEELDAGDENEPATLAPATFIDLKMWYNRFDPIDPNAPVAMTVDLNKPANTYTAAELARLKEILAAKGPTGG